MLDIKIGLVVVLIAAMSTGLTTCATTKHRAKQKKKHYRVEHRDSKIKDKPYPKLVGNNFYIVNPDGSWNWVPPEVATPPPSPTPSPTPRKAESF